MIITIFIIVILTILIFLFSNWITHYYLMFNFYNGRNSRVSHSFKEFKREFYNCEWQRDLNYKFSFFSTEKDPIKRVYTKRYQIHASVVIVNNIQFRFRPFNFIRYSIFLFKNRTNIKNYNEVVNNLRQKRRNKLQRIYERG